MSNIKNEVITKLRNDIRAKLDQIGAFVDNELADYIMVLVANQKTKYQMKDDLSLFLGAATDEFVNWLHTSLKQIQMSATQSEDKKVVVTEKKETKDSTKNTNLNVIKGKSKHKKTNKNDEKSVSVDPTNDKSDKISDESKDNPKVLTVSPQPKHHSEESDQKLVSNDKQITETVSKQTEKSETKEQNDGEVVLRLNADGDEVDELLQENISDDKKRKRDNQVKSAKRAKVMPLKREVISSNSNVSPVKKHKTADDDNEEEDEDTHDQNRPILASVVRVSERKSSVPIEMYANKKLLLKAVKDANDSTKGKRKRTADEVEYTPTPIKKRLGERQEVRRVDPEVADEEELDPQDLRNFLKVNKKDSDKKRVPEENITTRKVRQPIIYTETHSSPETTDPQFVVTLNGVNHNQFLQNTEFEDRIIFDEDIDEELVEPEADDGFHSEDLENQNQMVNKVNEKCRFWPTCKNGDECEFLHPNTPCKTFPNCRFGDKCLYIHPNCKFDAMCSRRDCPFTHASRRKIPTSAAIISSLLPPSSVKQCKYLPNCKNPACPYFHPKLCRFGEKCRHLKCPFFHPYVSFSAQPSVPHPHQLKWRAKNNISERQFSKESNTTATSTTS